MNRRVTGIDRIICILVSFMIMSFYIFEMMSWGRYVLLGIVLAVTALYVVQNHFRIKKSWGAFHNCLLAFVLFTFVSALWAWNPSAAISKGFSLLYILVCYYFLYSYYYERGNVELLVLAIMLSGYGVCVYAVGYYGVNGIVGMLTGRIRMYNDFANANAIGLAAALSCIIQFYYFMKKQYRWLTVFSILAVLIIAITQSRKAIIMLVLGITWLTMTAEGSGRKGALKKLLRFVIAIVVAVCIIYLLSRLEIFAGVVRRFEVYFESLRGERTEDIRSIYRRIGMQQFWKTPILGIGIGNSLELLENVGFRRTYLHCNYVELLASGGIVGFVVYYSMYGILAVNFWKCRHIRSDMTRLCTIIMLLLLVMDYALVSYYAKKQYIYLMLLFLQAAMIQKEGRQLR